MSYSPSLGGGESNYISAGEGGKQHDSLLSLPSPPQSRSSSANDSYPADLADDAGDESTTRGRPRSVDAAAKKELDAKNDKGNVLVSVRVRPESGGDGEASNASDGEWLVDGRRSLISFKGKEGGDYRYDNVFSPHDNNARVYDNAAKRLVRRVMEGYHGTVFAYGMTGTGKTFSMQGTSSSPGVIPLAITDIFSYIRENPNREFLLRVSYLEIYNERIYDLLSQSTPGQVQQEEIKLREDSKRGVYATPLKEEIVQSPNQLLRVIARGDTARRVGSTQFNSRSSRSHAVVSIVVESRERTSSHGDGTSGRRSDKILPGGVLVSTLSLIDLAGSEKAAENKERRAEGAHINKSLLTLGTVIGRLSNEDEKDGKDGAKSGDKEKAVKHLPYRDSKLTRLLQPALSGDSLVSILCTVQLSSAGTSAAHASSHTGETLNTLKFASRAKNNIVSHAKRNESNNNPGDPGSRALLDRYRLEIQELRTQLDKQNKAKEVNEEKDEFEQDRKREEELEKEEHIRHEEQMLEMQLARTALKERISHLNRLILSSKSIGVNSGRFSSSSVGGLNTRMSSYSLATDYGRPVSVGDTLVDSKRNSSTTNDGAVGDGADSQPRDRVVSATSTTYGEIPAAAMDRMEIDDTATNIGEDEAELVAEGEGQASLAQQVRMLQSDLSDKNRYITTLEKRLLQARRTSHSRVSMQFAARVGLPEDGTLEGLLRERDREIEELRAKLDDQMRMVTALRSAARKRDMIENRRSHVTDISDNTERPRTTGGTLDTDSTASTPADDNVPDMTSQAWRRHNSSRLSNRTSTQSMRLRNSTGGAGNNHRSTTSSVSRSSTGGAVVNFSSPMAILSSPVSVTFPEDVHDDKPNGNSGHSAKPRRKSVDEMTMLLDQMIQDKVESGHVVRGDRGSLRIRHDTVLHGNSINHTANDPFDNNNADDHDHNAMGTRFDTSPLNSPPLSSSANTSAMLLSPSSARAPNGPIAEEDEESPIIPSHAMFGGRSSSHQASTIGTITVTPTVPHTAPLPPVVNGLGLTGTWH
jgi:centromeric protein E